MTVELTPEQRQVLRMAAGEPPRLTDSDTREEYVLVRTPSYERPRILLYEDADADPSRAYPLLDEAFRAGWDDPRMAEYDHYEENTIVAQITSNLGRAGEPTQLLIEVATPEG